MRANLDGNVVPGLLLSGIKHYVTRQALPETAEAGENERLRQVMRNAKRAPIGLRMRRRKSDPRRLPSNSKQIQLPQETNMFLQALSSFFLFFQISADILAFDEAQNAKLA